MSELIDMDEMVIKSMPANNVVTEWDAAIEYATIIIGDDEPVVNEITDGMYRIEDGQDWLIVSVVQTESGMNAKFLVKLVQQGQGRPCPC